MSVPIFLFNSLTKVKEEFRPLRDGYVGMYHCGPTVYDDVHVGNLRAFWLADITRRVFEYNGYEVNQVMNITDVGHLSNDADEGQDKMTKALLRDNKPVTLPAMLELASHYQNRFIQDLENLNVLTPHHLPRASEHIQEDIDIIQKLFDKDFAYQISDGIYFDTSKYNNYGQLSGQSIDSQSRIEVNPEKKDFKDFALWKFNTEMGWDTPWGKGFPGWHIECSGMSMKYLGTSFDIHTGGIDLAPTHHNNEIAQSVCCTDKNFVNYWLHNEFVDMRGGKMSKSVGNTVTLRILEEEGFTGLDYRYWLLQGHYRSKVEFSTEALAAAKQGRNRLNRLITDLPKGGEIITAKQVIFNKIINDDLNMPEALALAWAVAKDTHITDVDKKATLLDFDKVLGLKLGKIQEIEIPTEISELIKKRGQARLDGNWKLSDQLREQIKNLGYQVEDKENRQTIRKFLNL